LRLSALVTQTALAFVRPSFSTIDITLPWPIGRVQHNPSVMRWSLLIKPANVKHHWSTRVTTPGVIKCCSSFFWFFPSSTVASPYTYGQIFLDTCRLLACCCNPCTVTFQSSRTIC
jgi:hypothetical protein